MSHFAKFYIPLKYFLRSKKKAQTNLITDIVDLKKKNIIGQIYLNLGSFGYQLANKTSLKSKFKKKVLVDNLVVDKELGLANSKHSASYSSHSLIAQEPNDNFTIDQKVHVERSKLVLF